MARVGLALACGAIAATAGTPMALDSAKIDKINGQNLGWTAGHNARMEGLTLEEARISLLGHNSLDLAAPQGERPPAPSAADLAALDEKLGRIPLNFDARTAWPGCVQAIRDQGSCGGCWAFATAESLSDRWCIESKGAVNVTLAPEDLLACDVTKYTLGCNGGVPEYAFKYVETTGISSDGCIPFAGNNTPACPATCADGTTMKKYKTKMGSTRLLNGASSAAQQYLATGGPLQAAFFVYDDFFAYKSGIYKRSPNATLMGKHSVKLVGYGVDPAGQAFWTVANSWGPKWGDKGFFKTLRGANQCGIENEIVCATPDV